MNTITYTTTKNVYEFEFWAGAENLMRDATQEQREAVYERLCDLVDESWSETDVNDYVWFECDDIFEDEDEQD